MGPPRFLPHTRLFSMKTCTCCKINKKKHAFVGKDYWCKECRSEYNKQDYKKKRVKVLKRNKKRYKRKKKEILAYASRWHKINRKLHPDKYKDQKLRADYGIGLKEYNGLREEQKQCCKICGIHENKLPKAICVDHCHKTGKIRGLLCEPCNRLLGNAKDSIKILKEALNYLNE